MKDILNKYWQLGLKTLPTKDNKAPYNVTTWKGGITDLNAYNGAFGIGVICGEESGNLECIDFDNHFGDAKEVLSNFISEIKEIYDFYNFPIESTISGGYHLIYRCDKIAGNLKLASRPKHDEKTNKFKPDTIIETRGEGGYFVCAPTEGYKWIRNDINNIPRISPEHRSYMFEVAKSFNTWYEIHRDYNEEENRPGDVYNNSVDAINDMKSVLTSNGWRELAIGKWQRPNKKDGISATIGKVAPNVFYVFSSSAYPFEPNKGYTPFQVLGLLKYNGDFKRFASELSEKYSVSKPAKKQALKEKPQIRTDDEFDAILRKAQIDVNIPVSKPPIIMKIRDFHNSKIYERRLFTLGNFSAITGKSKSKKSFLAAMFLAAATKNGIIDKKIVGCLPESKTQVVLFDTEQSNYDAYRYSKNVIDIIGHYQDNFITFALREFDPIERCEIIDYVLTKFKDSIGYVVIDGIADLVKAINDEDEATRVITLLMKWTKLYNNHITVNIHQNKNDSYATGWIGSYILKKAECIISVFKDEDNVMVSRVECTDIRGTAEFKDFEIEIQETGIPTIKDLQNVSTHYEVDEVPF
jgi:hypothetical protein